MAQWYSEGLMSQDFAVENENPTDSEYMGKITNGEVGIGFIDASYIDTLEETGGFDLEPIQDAVQNAGDVTHLSSCKDKEMEDTYVITTACENIEAAMLWNNYWYTEEGSMLANWGIEGETYTIENGEPAFTDLLLNNPDGLTLSQTTYIYIGKLGVYDSDRDQAMYSDQVNSVAGVWATNAYKIPQGVTMTAEESEDYNNIFSDINTYVQENLVKFIVGDLPLSDLESFVDGLYALDIETCIGYWQAALDRFNAR